MRALQLSGALTRFWYVENLIHEGQQWLKESIATNSSQRTNLIARALVGEGWLDTEDGNYLQGRQLCLQAQSIYHDIHDLWGLPTLHVSWV